MQISSPGVVTPSSVPASPSLVPLPADLQFGTQPLVIEREIGRNEPASANRMSPLWATQDARGRALGVRLDATSLTQAVEAARQIAAATEQTITRPEDYGFPATVERVSTQHAVLQSRDGAFFVAALRRQPAADASSANRVSATWLETTPNAVRTYGADEFAFIGAQPAVGAIVDARVTTLANAGH